ncbi:MAG: MBL fold metallo-hydrolase [Desulfobacteraceae bacterium]|nr:MAG: MBL fold metallo-hydrolase [Desulfobacteraceae bacterium]
MGRSKRGFLRPGIPWIESMHGYYPRIPSMATQTITPFALNINLRDINYVVLTHAHDDHAGFLNEVLEGTNAELVLHEKAVERLKIGHNLWIGGCPNLTAKIFVASLL